jgi:hypothetical protein
MAAIRIVNDVKKWKMAQTCDCGEQESVIGRWAPFTVTDSLVAIYYNVSYFVACAVIG